MKSLYAMILCMGFVACGNHGSENVNEALTVKTETIGETNLSASKSYVGVVEPHTSTAVSFTGMGTVIKVMVDEGQHVSTGQVLAQMDPTQSKNALDAAEAIMAQAQDAYDRMKILHDNNSISEMDWVEVQSKVQQARSSVEMAKKQLADCTLKAPCSGVIGQKMMQTGQTALPSQPVCNILDINNVKVKVSVPEKEIASISTSTPTRITIDAIGETISGGRIEKGVQADAVTHTYNININVQNNGQRLLPGMVANVEMNCSTNRSDNECVINSLPLRCVQQSANGKHFVWTVQNNKAHRQDITLGEVHGNRIEILSGVKNGDKVIVSGYQKVSEGSEVK